MPGAVECGARDSNRTRARELARGKKHGQIASLLEKALPHKHRRVPAPGAILRGGKANQTSGRVRGPH